ncbi:MAG: c-type cytochrome biogenesis protein CcmI [Hyphomicrobiaceae bacterium]
MLLWIAFALLTSAVLAAVLGPLVRAPRTRPEAEAGALAVYRDQLREIEAERTRGLLEESDAAAARVEVSRRLLASAGEAEARPGDGADGGALGVQTPLRLSPVLLAVAVLFPVLTLGLYLSYGSPGVPSHPIAGRGEASLEQARIGELIAKVETRLREHPEDAAGWDVIAPVYLKLGRFQEAAAAYANAARLDGETPRRLAGFAEASVLAADGIVTEQARLAYEKIARLEPARPEPRFWLALAKEQDGRLADALADYKALLADAPADAAWRPAVEGRIGDVSRRLAASQGGQETRGPTASDVAAAEKLAPEDRSRMIAAMVDSLAERLQRDGRDLAGWLRLVNAYAVLDRKDEARAALAKARSHFPGDEQALARLSALAQSLGLGS